MSEKSRQSGGNFLVQGSILAAAGIIVRLIGLLYKIPMTRILGDEGIGYYNTAYEIYNIGLILSSYTRLCHFIENESPRNVVFISISGRFALK